MVADVGAVVRRGNEAAIVKHRVFVLTGIRPLCPSRRGFIKATFVFVDVVDTAFGSTKEMSSGPHHGIWQRVNKMLTKTNLPLKCLLFSGLSDCDVKCAHARF